MQSLSNKSLGEKYVKDREKPLLEISASWHVDYSIQLEEYRDEFSKRWELDKPSIQTKAFKFEHLPVIGVGQYGTVRLMKMNDGQSCAVKILQKEHIIKLSCVQKTIMEKKLLYAINFPFIASLIFSHKDNDYLYLGLPFCAGSDLFNLLRKRSKFSESMARFYSSQILLALEYLHNVRCIYRDLKLENILVDASGYLKLTDFGLSKLVSVNKTTTTTLCGTPEYLSPEMISVKPYSYSVDWWTFGIFLYELVAGQTPFRKYVNNPTKMFSKICEGEFDMPNSFSPDLKDILSGLLDVCMGTRLGNLRNGCNDIKNHNFFRPVNWRLLLSQSVPAPFKPRLLHPSDTFHFEKFSVFKFKRVQRRSKENLYGDYFTEF